VIQEYKKFEIEKIHMLLQMTYELKQINGIPYYLNGSIVYTFELDAEKSKPVAIGTYNNESIAYYDDWRQRVQSNLDTFRESIIIQERDKLRESIIKPQKPRKATRTPRKSTKNKSPENI